MSYKANLVGSLDPIEWSQAVWRIEDRAFRAGECERDMLHPLLMHHLPKGGLIFDAGCGTAKWLIYLRRLGYRVVGADINDECCRIAKENEPELDLVKADARKLPVRDRSIDAVLSLGVVEHDEAGPAPSLRELHRVLKPNGLLVLTVPYNNWFRRLVINRLHDRVNRRRVEAGIPVSFGEYRFSYRELWELLASSAFEVLEAHPEDALPPKNVGLWVDYYNLLFNPLKLPAPPRLFELPGIKGKIATWLASAFPWLFCGEIALVVRAR
jgi:SAM-dependent methyltransferase